MSVHHDLPRITKKVFACALCVEVKTPRALFFHILCRRLPTPPKDTSSVQHLLVDADEVRPATEDSGCERGLPRCGGPPDGLLLF